MKKYNVVKRLYHAELPSGTQPVQQMSDWSSGDRIRIRQILTSQFATASSFQQKTKIQFQLHSNWHAERVAESRQ